MKVEAIGVALARRSMLEASDLGARLVGAHARSVWRCFLPVHACVVAGAALCLTWHETLSYLALFWLKPWLDRTLLFVLARAAFGEPTRFIDVWRAQREVWWRDLLPTLTLRRLHVSRSFVAPAQQLEGQRGAARRRRVRQILAQGRGASLVVLNGYACTELAITAGLVVLPIWFLAAQGIETPSLFEDVPAWLGAWQFVAYALAIAVVEPFFVGAGFGMYLNRRVELEAWDVEQELRVAFAGA
jgi:hypothetical protein